MKREISGLKEYYTLSRLFGYIALHHCVKRAACVSSIMHNKNCNGEFHIIEIMITNNEFRNYVHKQCSKIIKLQLARSLNVEYNGFYVDSKKERKKFPFNLSFSLFLSVSLSIFINIINTWSSLCAHMPNRGITGNN